MWLEATELPQDQTESNGPESQTMVLKHDEISETHSKSKEPVLARYFKRHHAPDQIIGDKSDGTMIISKLKDTCLLAKFEPRNVKDALKNEIEAMNEEIDEIENYKTWSLIARPKEKNVVGTKWVFKNKLN